MFTIIYNPSAGKNNITSLLGKVCNELDSLRIEYAVLNIMENPEMEMYASVPSGSDDTICVLGGDGTVLHTFNKLTGDSFRLIIVPCGTGNDFIKTLGIPKDPIKAFLMQLNGNAQNIDYLLANDRRFMNVMGAGFDVNVLCKLNAFKHKFSGLKAYLMAVIQATKEYSPVEFEISADDGEIIKKQLSIISAGNGKYIGGGMKAVPSAVPDDGLIDVVEVRAIKRWQLIFLLPLFVAGLHIKCGLGKTYRCRSLKLKSANMTYQLDGEVFSGESVEIKLVSGKLKASKATL